MLQVGQIIDRYRILRVLGQGGMAVVYAAQHVELGSLHAVKVLMITTQHLRDRALQEGRIQAALNHPNIVAVSDIVRLDGAPALVMELVRGPSLEGYLHHVRPSFEQMDSLARGLLDGLEEAHQKARIHRDLKPANVLLGLENGTVVAKLADFGLAKILSGDALSKSRTGVTMGTPAYMAPEQFRDAKNVDERADIFGLGVMLYELCTGAMPYQGDDMIALFQAIDSGQYVRPSQRVPELPARMERAINKALYADPEHRHVDVGEFRALWCDGRPAPQRPWSTKQLAEILEMGPSLPTPTPLNASTLRKPSFNSGPESQAAAAWERISEEPSPGAATMLPESFGAPPSGPDTEGLEPAPQTPPKPPPAPNLTLPVPEPSLPPPLPSPAEPASAAPPRSRSGLLLFAGAAALLLSLTGLWVWQGQGEEEGVPAAQPSASAEPVPRADLESPDPTTEVTTPEVASLTEPGDAPVRSAPPVLRPDAEPAIRRAAVLPEPEEPEPEPEPEAVPEPEPLVAAEPTQEPTTSVVLRGVNRGYLVSEGGRQQGFGAVPPGKYTVFVFFDAAKATQVLTISIAEGQKQAVNCDPGIRMCRIK